MFFDYDLNLLFYKDFYWFLNDYFNFLLNKYLDWNLYDNLIRSLHNSFYSGFRRPLDILNLLYNRLNRSFYENFSWNLDKHCCLWHLTCLNWIIVVSSIENFCSFKAFFIFYESRVFRLIILSAFKMCIFLTLPYNCFSVLMYGFSLHDNNLGRDFDKLVDSLNDRHLLDNFSLNSNHFLNLDILYHFLFYSWLIYTLSFNNSWLRSFLN